MTDGLKQRVADALGWSVADVDSFSLLALRELVSLLDHALAQELGAEVASGRVVTLTDERDAERSRLAERVDAVTRAAWARRGDNNPNVGLNCHETDWMTEGELSEVHELQLRISALRDTRAQARYRVALKRALRGAIIAPEVER